MFKWSIRKQGQSAAPSSASDDPTAPPVEGTVPNDEAAPAGTTAANAAAASTESDFPFGGRTVAKSIADWMREGEELYAASLQEFKELEAQINDLERRLGEKQEEVNQIAQIIGRPMVEGNRRLTAQLIDDHGPHSVPNSPATIARALAGKNLNR